MFFSLASIALLAVSVAAQGGFPQCAVQCLDPTQSVNGCGPTDNACLCNDNAFISSTTTCINTNCQGDDVENAQSAARSLCAAVLPLLHRQAHQGSRALALPTSNAASFNGVNSFAGIAALGLAALAL
ncbi:hypothetical protein BDN71DRAFT_899202 [Pleurotus eryngii]|uniref:CFEM domain-containing protein n=1 Tax=Pleurotus eryngii TaxID=5323 RepID=A0A9P6D716_PLEER|nr:hypothetical protein BDN71DRAFT_899202 [Pleurotus eryngii]